MIIGIYIDDTITDTYEVTFNYAQDYTINVLKRDGQIHEIDCNTHMYAKSLCGWKDDEDIDFFRMYYERIINETKPKTLALEYLNKLHEDGNKIVIITARWETDYIDVKKLTEEWIKKYNIPCDKLIINAENKGVAALEENVDVFIDDSYRNCKAISNLGIKTYIMDTRVNRNLNDEKIKRVYSWPHFYKELEEYKKEANK